MAAKSTIFDNTCMLAKIHLQNKSQIELEIWKFWNRKFENWNLSENFTLLDVSGASKTQSKTGSSTLKHVLKFGWIILN